MKHLSITLFFILFTFNAAAEKARVKTGAELYKENCANCHDSKGDGGIGLPLNTRKLHMVLSDKYIFRTIKNGRPGRVMPSFADMPESHIRAIIKHMRSWSSHRASEYSPVKIKGNFNQGRAIYKKSCAGCHGVNMEGDREGTGVTKSRARKNKISPPALSNPGFLNAAADMMIKDIIGKWHDEYLQADISDNGLNDVVFYLRKRGRMLASQWRMDVNSKRDPIYKYFESPYGLEETKKNLQNAIKGMNFRAYSPRFLEQDLVEQGDEETLNRDQTVFRFCNFRLLNEFLKIEPRLGVVLPCNATIIKTPEGKIMVAIPNLARIVRFFNNRQLIEKSRDMINILDEMIEEALL